MAEKIETRRDHLLIEPMLRALIEADPTTDTNEAASAAALLSIAASLEKISEAVDLFMYRTIDQAGRVRTAPDA